MGDTLCGNSSAINPGSVATKGSPSPDTVAPSYHQAVGESAQEATASVQGGEVHAWGLVQAPDPCVGAANQKSSGHQQQTLGLTSQRRLRANPFKATPASDLPL